MQDNCCDCGVYLLHYAEQFCQQNPSQIGPEHIKDKFRDYLSPKMFNSRDISRKRVRMRDLIYKLQDKLMEGEKAKKRRKTGDGGSSGNGSGAAGGGGEKKTVEISSGGGTYVFSQ